MDAECVESQPKAGIRAESVRLFLCGDVMTGRGIDQILPHPCDPRLHEPYVRDARDYVRLAEEASGPIPSPAGWDYVWGEALGIWDSMSPQVRIVNLETSVTGAGEPWPAKGIHYRMNAENTECLRAAKIDVACLANNHVLDWGTQGLSDTIAALNRAGISAAGAGEDAEAARTPATLPIGSRGRILVFSVGLGTSGVPAEWAARPNSSGVYFAPEPSMELAEELAGLITAARRSSDVVVLSVHWGGNWGFAISRSQREFAHQLIEAGQVDVLFGHSSHHVKGVEVHHGHPILYGCGDFLTDYEGIGGREHFRGDLNLMYFLNIDPGSGELRALTMIPTTLERFQVRRPSQEGEDWLAETLSREGRRLGTSVQIAGEGFLELVWS